MYDNKYMRELFQRAGEFAKHEDETTFRIEKIYSTGDKDMKDYTFKKRCEAYRFIIDDFLSETLNKAIDEMSDEDFKWLVSQAIARAAEYLQR